MTSPALFAIEHLRSLEELEPPDNGPYFVATRKGWFIHRNFHFGRVLVPIAEAAALPETTAALWREHDPIPSTLIGQALSFFKTIYEKRKSEAMVDITWHPTHGYRLFVPPQRATGGGVNATRTPEHYQGQIVGTIHSHCNFSAFHSGVDKHDADGHDGLHITIGDVLKDKPSIAIMIAAAGIEWDQKLEDISDGPLAITPHPVWWERYVSDPEPVTPATRAINWWDDDTTWQQRPTGTWAGSRAITSYPGSKPKPTSGKREISASHLTTIIWQYQDLFQPDELYMLEQADKIVDDARQILDHLGVELDTTFTLEIPNGTVANQPKPTTSATGSTTP